MVVAQAGTIWGGNGKTEAHSVLSSERGTRQLREHSGGRSCDGVTRNKSDIKLESDPLAP